MENCTSSDRLEDYSAGAEALEGGPDVKDPHDPDDFDTFHVVIYQADDLGKNGNDLEPVRALVHEWTAAHAPPISENIEQQFC